MSTAVAWSREEDRAFENAIALHWSTGFSSEEPWEKIAALVPTKTVQELKHHFQILEQDVSAIQEGHVPIPSYDGQEASPPPSPTAGKDSHRPAGDKRSASDYGRFSGSRRDSSTSSEGGKGGSRSEQERRKGIPWTEDEHRLFLLGLEKFGKGDWRSIARNFVISRTPTQVASHAQKYFIRLNSLSSRDRRRSSIHDITSVNSGASSGDAAASSGQANAPPITSEHASALPDQAAKHRCVGSGAMGIYGVPMGHPVVAPLPGHMASAIGTPVMVPAGHHHHPHYVVPVAYPVVPPSGHHS